ncbi:hypothetical protein GCM10011380_01170 [Sphingomonas metalli]|uniref:Uncharacterized protein n=1 Tax=Sphingomonas metalli TaxID=1779358 RepID=A0A916WMR7_9SPHN|nr:hypothetical protein [Sphingomonas metalli]GGB15500.1 hypothetical protein GCM10011380_01170 [Sphingomonas metalli]
MTDTNRLAGARRLLRLMPVPAGVLAALLCPSLSAESARVTDRLSALGLAVSPQLLQAVVAVAAGGFTWALLYLALGPQGWLERATSRRARMRPPLSFADIGPPPPREQPLPTDLDQPLAAYDPDAIAFHQARAG